RRRRAVNFHILGLNTPRGRQMLDRIMASAIALWKLRKLVRCDNLRMLDAAAGRRGRRSKPAPADVVKAALTRGTHVSPMVSRTRIRSVLSTLGLYAGAA